MDLSKLLHGFVKIDIWISLCRYMDLSKLNVLTSVSCNMDLSKLLHGFFKVVTRISQGFSVYFSPFDKQN